MAKCEFNSEYAAGTAVMLRMLQNYKGSGRVVNAVSWFALVKSAVVLQNKIGLRFRGLVKRAHRHYPMKFFECAEVKERGDHLSLVTEKDGVKMLACAWADAKTKTLVATAGITLPGEPHEKERYRVEDGVKVRYIKEVKQPSVAQKYFEAASAIDQHNQLRQGIMSFETALRTHFWDRRFVSSILGKSFVDSYNMYCYENRSSAQALRRYPSLFHWQDVVTYRLLDNRIGVAMLLLRPREVEKEPSIVSRASAQSESSRRA